MNQAESSSGIFCAVPVLPATAMGKSRKAPYAVPRGVLVTFRSPLRIASSSSPFISMWRRTSCSNSWITFPQHLLSTCPAWEPTHRHRWLWRQKQPLAATESPADLLARWPDSHHRPSSKYDQYQSHRRLASIHCPEPFRSTHQGDPSP